MCMAKIYYIRAIFCYKISIIYLYGGRKNYKFSITNALRFNETLYNYIDNTHVELMQTLQMRQVLGIIQQEWLLMAFSKSFDYDLPWRLHSKNHISR